MFAIVPAGERAGDDTLLCIGTCVWGRASDGWVRAFCVVCGRACGWIRRSILSVSLNLQHSFLWHSHILLALAPMAETAEVVVWVRWRKQIEPATQNYHRLWFLKEQCMVTHTLNVHINKMKGILSREGVFSFELAIQTARIASLARYIYKMKHTKSFQFCLKSHALEISASECEQLRLDISLTYNEPCSNNNYFWLRLVRACFVPLSYCYKMTLFSFLISSTKLCSPRSQLWSGQHVNG
jgi:hypothetical protein